MIHTFQNDNVQMARRERFGIAVCEMFWLAMFLQEK